ncbi:MAG TPA: MaoC/PaaZ C-terminal domain-containing protein [Acidimicrobiales bacterium]|nr:MaoC/PaaZ C-terminal domain-containing protein [Acidimicrobiales bacterium]
MSNPPDPSTLAPAQEIPAFVRQPGLHHWNRYAAVNDEFVPIHMDDEAGREAGYDGAFGMGNLQWAYLHDVLRQWLGDEGRIERVSCQFRGPNLKGQTVTARGRIKAVRRAGERFEVDLDVWTENQDGEPLAPGEATVSLPARA